MFFTTPHGAVYVLTDGLLDAGAQVIDLSTNFRLADVEEWTHWYDQLCGAPALLGKAVHGPPEVNHEEIHQVRLAAIPGCYPAATQLGLIPPLGTGLTDTSRLIANCRSRVNGVDRGARIDSLPCEAGGNIMACVVEGRRHLLEINRGLRRASDGGVGLTFIPYLAPMIRGIHAILYAHVADHSVNLQALFEKRYTDKPFVDMMSAGSHSKTRSVHSANVCRIAVHRLQSGDLVVVLLVIDNLVRGTSDQTLQDMGILFGLDERLDSSHAALLP